MQAIKTVASYVVAPFTPRSSPEKDAANSLVVTSYLERIGYSATALRNAGYSSRAIAAMNKRLHEVDRKDVPHYSERRAQTVPWACPGQSTPRIRHFADDNIKNNRTKGLFKRKVNLLMKSNSAISALQSNVADAKAGKKPVDARPNTAPESDGRRVGITGAAAQLSFQQGKLDDLRIGQVPKQVQAVALGGSVDPRKSVVAHRKSMMPRKSQMPRN
jgi:hypothetical protein